MCVIAMLSSLVRMVPGVKPESPPSVAILGVVKPLAPLLAETGCFLVETARRWCHWLHASPAWCCQWCHGFQSRGQRW